ncbi:hypothetical protein AYL99_01928 [Fonsecaea erecta]|uniref:Protein kinase domain-containing protein n=1 Tax=Fonsecaea erecta TaxID=1367422 RepID=A0A178ZTD8_9EURO|nr:hypothetical protein AYL99_01928 [Fonsecaea erecta]OAP62701.1 hypothetical protein AYL99_01928 [Fonsecaea erecta]
MTPGARSSDPSHLLQEFRTNLDGCWKQNTYCGRHYIKTNEVLRWMTSVKAEHKATNLNRLHDEVWRSRPNSTFKPSAENFSSGVDCAIIVFSVLLAIDYGHLLDLFVEANITDASVHTASAEYHYKILKQYLERAEVPNADTVVESFKERKWSFCPVVLKRRMHGDFPRRCVFPYYKRQPVNGKGGTAEVFQVLVPAECIEQDLREFLQGSRIEYQDEGQFYELALKSYASQNQEMFEWEKNAFAGLEDQEGMVRYIGHYSFEEAPGLWTHNILLEFGELDLDEFFAHEYSSPPVRSLEIISFWKSLFKIAEALRRIHNLKIRRDGETQEFHGWHADVKPDNILRVHGEFKLVDFGFTKFKKKGNQATPREYMVGGTQTYGAPETDQSRFKTRTPHGQTIDTWSFGCVLSRAATWVILGQQGILQYDFVRKAAIKRLREQGPAEHRANSGCPTAHDAFHNGRTVLPAVIQWHHYLRSIVRTSDITSCRVLKLVEERMLLEDPEKRVTSAELCVELEDIVLLAKAKTDKDALGKRIAESLLTDLFNFDKEAPANQAQASHPKPAKSTKASGRIGKSQRLDNIPPAKTAHRAEMLTKELQIPKPLLESPQIQFGTILDEPSGIHGSHMHESPNGYIDVQEDASFVPPLPLSPTSQINGATVLTEPYSWRPSELVLASHLSPRSAVADLDHDRPSSTNQVIELRGDIGSTLQSDKSRGKMPLHETSAVEQGYQQRRVSKVTSHPGEEQPDRTSATSRMSTRRDSKLESAEISKPRSSSITFADLFAAAREPPPLDQNYDICRVKEDLEQTRHRITGNVKVDKFLRDFIVNRDMIFVVDNGSSMLQFWPSVSFVLETLAMKLAPLDKDGLDLVFTSAPQKTHKGKGSQAGTRFVKLLVKKKPAFPQNAAEEVKTDMTETLGVIFNEYIRSNKNKRMTLLVLTDGLWRGTKCETAVETKIADFVRQTPLNGNHMEDRRFSISFIRFGDYPEAIARLQRLDDDFSGLYKVPDMIDHVPWTGRVRKMILGSFVAHEDD